MASSVFEKSSLRLGNIQQHMSGFQAGLNQAASTIVNINKTLFKQKKDNQKLIKKDRFKFDKQQSLERAKLAEEQVEAKNVNTKLSSSKPEDAVKNNPKRGFLGRMLDFIGLLVGGWLLLNWKTIFNLGKGFLKRINGIIKIFRGFVTGVADFFRGLPSAIAGAAAGLFSVTDFQPEAKAMNKGLINLQQNLVNMQDQMNLVSDEYKRAANDLSEEPQPEDFPLLDTSFNNDDDMNIDDESASVDNAFNPLLDLIGSAEASQHGYNSIAPNDHNPDLTTMTIAEAAKAIGVNGGKGAIGRYQFTKPIEQAKLAGLGPDDIFSEANQDKMAIALMKNRGITMEMIRDNPNEAGNLLAKEWASLPLLSGIDGKNRGDSYYKGISGNQAKVTVERLEAILKQIAKMNPKPKGDSREGYSNQGWDFLNWIPDDILNRKDLSSLNIEKGPNVVYVPEISSKDQSIASSSGKKSSSSPTIIMGDSGLNRDDVLINELAYT